MKKKIVVALIAIVLIIIIVAMIMVPKINQFDRYMSELVINDFNLEAIEDGSYTGNVDSGVIVVEVQVDVVDQQK